jgi:chemotaxis protein histidine kinase CheA
MKNDWFDKLRDKMEDYEKSAPEGLWDEIEASLPDKKHAAPLAWVWRSAAIAAVLALGVFATIRVSHNNNTPEAIVAQADSDKEPARNSDAAIMEKTPEEVSIVENKNTERLASAQPQHAGNSIKAKRGVAENPDRPLDTKKDEEDIRVSAPATTDANTAISEPSIEKREATEAQRAEELERAEEEEANKTAEFLRLAEAEDKYAAKSSHPISVSLSVGSGATESNSSGVFNTMMFNAGASPYSGPEIDEIATRTITDEVKEEDIYDDANHKRPIRMGIVVNYPISKVFGIESGVYYSILNSTFTTTSSGTETEDSQKLHYIGIPLNVTANILNKKYIRLYAMAGGMGEKCVSGKVTTTVYEDGVGKLRTTKKDLDVDGLEWSVNAAGGIQFNFTDYLGIYAEPGVSYHFDNNSNVNTIYTDRQFDFMLNFGIRFSLNRR